MDSPSSSSSSPRKRTSGMSEINWDRLDKRKFYSLGAGLFTGITVALYPISVIKTRMQVASKDAERNVFAIVRNILKADGVPGLYRGFGIVITGAIPARIVFLTSLETTKLAVFGATDSLNLSQPIQAVIVSGVAGMVSAIIAQGVYVPVDVVSMVSQRLMVQGYSGHVKYAGPLDVARRILRTDGLRGFYKGFGLSVMTYAPSNGVWWASYDSSQRYIWRLLGNDAEKKALDSNLAMLVSVQATSAIIAGAMSAGITTPLDTIKTRLQVDIEKKENIKQVYGRLMAEDGWKGLYRGLFPRFINTTTWGGIMVLAYEYLKRICVKD